MSQAIVLTGSQLFLLVEGSPNYFKLWIVLGIVAIALAGVGLWVWAEKIAYRISDVADKRDQLEEGEVPASRPRPLIDVPTGLSLGLTILGIVLLVDAAAGVILVIGQLTQSSSSVFEGSSGFASPSRWPLLFPLGANLLRAAVGAWLIFGVHDIVGWFRRIRDPYTQARPEE